MKNTEEVIWDTITNSAKKRFDYKSFEAVFREMGGNNLAENILFKVVVGFALGASREELASELRTDMLLLGCGFEEGWLERLLESKEEELRTEIHVTQFTREMLDQGSDPTTILVAVSKMLD